MKEENDDGRPEMMEEGRKRKKEVNYEREEEERDKGNEKKPTQEEGEKMEAV